MVKKNMTQLARKALLRRGRSLLKLRTAVGTDPIASGLSEHQLRELEEVHAALERIERGIFGACEDCGERIGEDRIERLPYVRSCGACADASVTAPPPPAG